MEQQSITPYTGVQRAPNTAREVLGILFRNKRILLVTFVAIFAGVVLAVFLFGTKYQAQTEILVKHQRSDNVVSADASTQTRQSSDHARQREINTEIALLQSQDLLAKVVKACGLDTSHHHFWSGWLPSWGPKSSKTETAVRHVQKHLEVSSVPDSNIIQVRYTSHDPQRAARVLKALDKFYIAKHVAVYRPAGVVKFFQSQEKHYKTELADAETQLASFNTQQDAPAPDVEKNLVLKQASQFGGQLQQTRASITSTEKEIRAIQAELAKTPARIATQHTTGQNPQLMANLKSTLQNLEIQRTALLAKYQPTYRPVKEIEKQIAQVKATIASVQKSPMQQETTDQNPTYETLESRLAQEEAKLAALHAQAIAMAPVVHTYYKQAVLLDRKQIKQQNLLRNIKTAQQSYLLYYQKTQQARISDALNRRRILNVAVAETAAVPSLPVNSPSILILAGGILALIISMGTAFTVDYMNPSFRTPDEVIRFLDVPVLAALPKNAQSGKFALPAANNGNSPNKPAASKKDYRIFPRDDDQKSL